MRIARGLATFRVLHTLRHTIFRSLHSLETGERRAGAAYTPRRSRRQLIPMRSAGGEKSKPSSRCNNGVSGLFGIHE